MDRRALVVRAGQGDHDAFAVLATAASARLDAAARLILRDPELARDAVQNTLMRAWRDPGLIGQGPRIQAGFNWNGGRDFSVQTNYVQGYLAFQSDALGAHPGEFRIRAQASADGCSRGDVGTYAWTRSTDGLFLTVTLVADSCAQRASTLART